MSFNSMLRWMKPRETVFFDLLEGATDNAFQAAILFDRELRAGDPERFPELRRQMKEHERRGDEITHEIVEKLNQYFVTPIDREDILSLAHALDDVVDRLDAVTERLMLYRITGVLPAMTEIASIAVEGCSELQHLIRGLRDMREVESMRLRIKRVHTLENKGDSLFHSALAEIFRDPQDPILLIKWKEILEIVEDATDRIELVAKVVGSTVMKNA
ncbi:MAG: DUF47 family protein [Acidobacteria bacterium]|nr:DUF47 family protein [Acidobacteriota bacterium]